MDSSLLEALHPLHPRLVHFPIALVISAMGIQALGIFLNKEALRKAAWIMFVTAVISMPVVVVTGLWEEQHMHLNHPVLTLHKNAALMVMWSSLAVLPFLWLIRNNKVFPVIFLIFLIIASGLLGFTAHQGGRMVFEYGVGVSQ